MSKYLSPQAKVNFWNRNWAPSNFEIKSPEIQSLKSFSNSWGNFYTKKNWVAEVKKEKTSDNLVYDIWNFYNVLVQYQKVYIEAAP